MRPSVLVNCDDLGMHPAINEAIVEILAEGNVKSASIMAIGNAFDDAVERLHRAGISAIGAHLALGSEYADLPTHPLAGADAVPALVRPDGRLHARIQDVRGADALRQARVELTLQIARIRAAGLRITHLDGHMFFYRPEEGGEEMLRLVQSLAARLGVPFRDDPARPSGPPFFIWDDTPGTGDRIRCYAEWFAAGECHGREVIIHPAVESAALRSITRSSTWRHADYLAFRSERLLPALGGRVDLVSWEVTSS